MIKCFCFSLTEGSGEGSLGVILVSCATPGRYPARRPRDHGYLYML